MDAMTLDISQILSNMPIAGAMIWFAIHITKESRKERLEHYKSSEQERREWTEERKEIYEKIMKNIMEQNQFIETNTKTLELLIQKKCPVNKK